MSVQNESSGDEEVIRLSDDAMEVLSAVYENNGIATTTEIKGATGLDNDTIRYRLRDSADSLEGYGLVEVGRVPEEKYQGTGRFRPYQAELTEKGEREIQEGLLGDEVFESGVDEGITVRREQLSEIIDSISALEERVDGLSEVVQNRSAGDGVGDERTVGSDGRGVNESAVEAVSERVDSVQERVVALEAAVEDGDVSGSDVSGSDVSEVVGRVEELEEDLRRAEAMFVEVLELLERELRIDSDEVFERAQERVNG